MSDTAAGHRGGGGGASGLKFFSIQLNQEHLWHGNHGGHHCGADEGQHHLTQLGAVASSPKVAMAMVLVIMATLVTIGGVGGGNDCSDYSSSCPMTVAALFAHEDN